MNIKEFIDRVNNGENPKKIGLEEHSKKVMNGKTKEEYFYQTGRDLNKDLENVMSYDDMKSSQLELEKIATASEIEQNPLSAYSITELKKELRRRKGKLK